MRLQIVLVLLLSVTLLLKCCHSVQDDSDDEHSRHRRQTPRGRGRGRSPGRSRGRGGGFAEFLILSNVASSSPTCVTPCLSDRSCSRCITRSCAALGKWSCRNMEAGPCLTLYTQTVLINQTDVLDWNFTAVCSESLCILVFAAALLTPYTLIMIASFISINHSIIIWYVESCNKFLSAEQTVSAQANTTITTKWTLILQLRWRRVIDLFQLNIWKKGQYLVT